MSRNPTLEKCKQTYKRKLEEMQSKGSESVKIRWHTLHDPLLPPDCISIVYVIHQLNIHHGLIHNSSMNKHFILQEQPLLNMEPLYYLILSFQL